MTIDKISSEQQEIRDFIDALRVCLGKAPLYFQDSQVTIEERFVYAEAPLPSTALRTDEWFQAAAAMPDETHTRQDRSVALAVKRLGRTRPAMQFQRRTPG